MKNKMFQNKEKRKCVYIKINLKENRFLIDHYNFYYLFLYILRKSVTRINNKKNKFYIKE